VKIEAGGRISWSDGAGTYDTNLYRDGVNTLATDDVLKAISGVVTMSVEGIPTAALPDGAIAIDTLNDTFYFRSSGTWNQVSGEGSASVIIQANPPTGQDEGTLWLDTDTLVLSIYYNSQWIEVGGSGGLATSDIDGGNQLLDDILEAEVTNWPIAAFDGGTL
jgi:hypothetical protein